VRAAGRTNTWRLRQPTHRFRQDAHVALFPVGEMVSRLAPRFPRGAGHGSLDGADYRSEASFSPQTNGRS
jgi:hypothetical protein